MLSCVAAILHDVNGTDGYIAKNYTSGMVQSWNKFCFTGEGLLLRVCSSISHCRNIETAVHLNSAETEGLQFDQSLQQQLSRQCQPQVCKWPDKVRGSADMVSNSLVERRLSSFVVAAGDAALL